MAEPVTLHLRNGDRLSGELLSMSTTNFVLTNGLLGRLSVPLPSVERMERIAATNIAAVATNPPQTAVTATPSAAPTATNQVAATAPANPAATVTNAPAAPVPKAPVAALAPPPPKPKGPKLWAVDVQFGTDLEFNQTQRELYYGRAKATYGLDRFRASLDYLANYGIYAGVVSANDMLGTGRVEFDLTEAKRLYIFNALAIGYNEIRKIDLGINESLGLGYKFITRTNFTYGMDLGLNYQYQRLSDGTVKNFEGLRIGEHANWIINPRWNLDQKLDCLPQYSGSFDFQTRLEVNLRYLLLSNLTLNFTVIEFYDTQPAPGVSNNDLLLRGTIGVRF